MLKLVVQKYDSSFSAGQNEAINTPAFKQNNLDEKKTFIQTLKDNKINIFAGSLLTSGGILFYLGLAKPGKNKVFNKFVESKIKDMEVIVRRFTNFSSDNIVTSFKETVAYIANYRKTRILNPSDFLTQINLFKEPSKLTNAQDMAFSSIYAKQSYANCAAASDIDEFSTKFNKIKYRVIGEIEREKHRVEMELNDYRILPENKNMISKDKVVVAETRLKKAQDNFVEYMTKVKDSKLNTAVKSQYSQMADAIVEASLSNNQSKEIILDTVFEKLRHILDLGEDFIPEYSMRRYNLPELKNIFSSLKPKAIPKDIIENIEPSIYLKIVEEEDLRKLSIEDLKKIFYKTSSTYNLKDLRYLIDRIRIHEVVAQSKGKVHDMYAPIITKLKYLSNKLNDFGEKQVCEYSKFDFAKLNEEQRKAKLYYLSVVGRRLGYENFDLLNRYMLQVNESYRKLSLQNYAKDINNNPDLYFIG